jgi:hypothetical protein
MFPISRLIAIPLFVLLGGASVALVFLALELSMRVPPVLSGMALGGSVVLPAVVGGCSARRLMNRVSVTVAGATVSFPIGLHLVMGLFPEASTSLWASFASGLPVGVPLAVGILLAHVRALEIVPSGPLVLGQRFRIVLVYLFYGALALIPPSLHFAFRQVPVSPSIHVLLWGGGLTVVLSQAVAMTLALRLRT